MVLTFIFFIDIYIFIYFFLPSFITHPQLTNNLQKKLNDVRREKEALEKCNPMSKAELEARLEALRKAPGGDFDMSEDLEEKGEESMDDGE